MKLIRQLLMFSFVLFLISCNQTPPPKPVGPIPSEKQLAWHELELYAFVHFNINTFTNIEWGFGSESPDQFNPSELDCRQWAKVCKDAGFKGIIITAKHHDGFCLWPSKFTEHSVKNSVWKNGKGDVLRELREACDEFGLEMGMYYSPWDRNHTDYGTPEYIIYMRNQLTEILTNYGDIFEVWFDGANGGSGYYGGANETRNVDRKTYYDWQNTYNIVRELQPNAVMFSDAGPDVRWCGNEEGWVGETNWSILRRDEVWPGWPHYEQLRTGHEDGTHWVPAEIDVSIRPGWYYHEWEDHKVKTLPQLLDIYYNSIGRGGSFLLNFPVDKRGLIHEKDVEQVTKLGKAIKADFVNNLAAGKKAEATASRGNSKKYAAQNVIDANKETYWTTDDNITKASLTINLEKPTEFNRFLVQEYIKLGQRVQKFTLEVFNEGNWEEIASETTIGYKRILRFDPVVASKIRLNINKSKACPLVSNIEVYNAPKVLVQAEVFRNKEGLITITAFDKGIDVFYTTDGSEPTTKSNKYSGVFNFAQKGTIKTVVVDPGTGKKSPVLTRNFDVPKNGWKLIGEFEKDNNSNLIFDGNKMTTWYTGSMVPSDFIIDLGEAFTLKGFTYIPGQERYTPGIIFNYEFFVSLDGKSWGAPVAKGEFSNIKNSPVLQEVKFDNKTGRFVKLRAVSLANDVKNIGIAEFDIVTN